MTRPKNVVLGGLMLLGLLALTGCGGEARTTLRPEEPREVGDGKMVVDLTDDDTTVATVVAWTRTHRDGMREILVHFPYIEGMDYRLNSFSIEVTAGDAIKPEMLMEPPPYPWKSTTFHRTEHGMRFEVPDVADYGVGSVGFSFWVSENVMAAQPLVIRATLGVTQGEGTAEIQVGQ